MKILNYYTFFHVWNNSNVFPLNYISSWVYTIVSFQHILLPISSAVLPHALFDMSEKLGIGETCHMWFSRRLRWVKTTQHRRHINLKYLYSNCKIVNNRRCEGQNEKEKRKKKNMKKVKMKTTSRKM